jgi:hypothetical protein
MSTLQRSVDSALGVHAEQSGNDSHHVLDIDEGVVDSNNPDISLGVGEGRAGDEATDTAEAVDTDVDRHGCCGTIESVIKGVGNQEPKKSANTKKHKTKITALEKERRRGQKTCFSHASR